MFRVEQASPLPGPNQGNEYRCAVDYLKKGNKISGNRFDHSGIATLEWPVPKLSGGGTSLTHIWGSNILRWDPETYRVRMTGNEGLLQVYRREQEGEVPVQVIDPANIKAIDPDSTGRVEVQEGGYVFPAGNEFQRIFVARSVHQALELLLQAERGEADKLGGFHLDSFVIPRVRLEPGTPVTVLHFRPWFLRYPAPVVINPATRIPVERELVFPFANPIPEEFAGGSKNILR